MKEGWALKVTQQLAIRGLAAYKSVAYKKVSVYCKLWISLAYCYNDFFLNFKYSVFKILAFITLNHSESNA